jgi:hypothetical protein
MQKKKESDSYVWFLLYTSICKGVTANGMCGWDGVDGVDGREGKRRDSEIFFFFDVLLILARSA